MDAIAEVELENLQGDEFYCDADLSNFEEDEENEATPKAAEVEESVCKEPPLKRKDRSKWENPTETYLRKRELKKSAKQERLAKQKSRAEHRGLEAALPEARPTDPLLGAQPRPKARRPEPVEEAEEQSVHAIAAQVVPQERS